MRYFICYILLLTCVSLSFAQNDLRFSLDFNQASYTDNSTNNNSIIHNSTLELACGVFNNGARFNGDDGATVSGIVNDFFERNNLTVSFYFQPNNGSTGTQTILSKRSPICDSDGVFEINYNYSTQEFEIFLAANDNINTFISVPRDQNSIYQHLVLNRDGRMISVYLNGLLVENESTNTIINLFSFSDLNIGQNPCFPNRELSGTLDELRISTGFFDEGILNTLFMRQGGILNRLDTIIILGDGVQINLEESCAQSVSWSPLDGVDNPTSPEPFIQPTIDGDFTYIYTGRLGPLREVDSIRIRVVDPEKLECTAFFPNAFTPNDDGLNDRFRLVNIVAVTGIETIEVFDNIGNRVYIENGTNIGWDGSVNGEPAPPGAYFYRSTYLCDDEKQHIDGTVTVIR